MSRFSAVYTEHLIYSIIGFLDIPLQCPIVIMNGVLCRSAPATSFYFDLATFLALR